jgi:hypothetical protein
MISAPSCAKGSLMRSILRTRPRMRWLILCAGAMTALGGCQFASGPTVEQSHASIPQVPPDRGRIFLYRPYNYIGSAAPPPTLIVDKSLAGKATLVGAFYCDLTPGKHTVWGTEYVSSPTVLNIDAGQVVYLRVEPSLSGFEIVDVKAETGAAEIQSMHLVPALCSEEPAHATAETVLARPPVDEALASGSAAEERGEFADALNIYTNTLQKYVTRLEAIPDVVDRAIDVAIRMRPAPVIPESAQKHASVAVEAIKDAKTKTDFAIARREYANALVQAPWWADAWMNLSLVDEQVGSSADVRRDLTWYLRAAPSAPDRASVEGKILGLRP